MNCILAFAVTVQSFSSAAELTNLQASADVENFNSAFGDQADYCRELYYCNSTRESGCDELACSCNDYCSTFDSCCRDKRDVVAGPGRLPKDYYVCATYLPWDGCLDAGVFVVNRCPPNSADAILNGQCESQMNATAVEADFAVTPATDNVTGITYRNSYCAQCWNVTLENTVMWTWNFTCDVEPSRRVLKKSADENDDVTRTFEEIISAAAFLRSRCATLTYEPHKSVAAKLHRCRPSVVESCPAEAAPAVARACSDGSLALTYTTFGTYPYKNVDCALCSSAASAALQMGCIAPLRWMPPNAGHDSGLSSSFGMLLSPSSHECPLAGTPLARLATTVGDASRLCARAVRCLFDRTPRAGLADECSFLCPVGQFTPGGGCRLSNSSRTCDYKMDAATLQRIAVTAREVSFENDTLVVHVNDTVAACFSCVMSSHAHFDVLANGSALFVVSSSGAENATYEWPFFAIDGKVARVCIPQRVADAGSSYEGCTQLPGAVSNALIIVSVAALIAFLVLYAAISQLRRFPGDMVANESCAFLLAYSLFLLRPTAAAGSHELCAALAASIHFFFTAAFAWTALYSAEIVRAVSFHSDVAHDSRRRRAVYYALGWGVPLALVCAGLLADSFLAGVRPSYGLPQCFIRSRLGNRVFFLAPLCLCVSISVAIYAFMVVKLGIIGRQTNVVRRAAQHDKIFLGIKLAFSLGLLWTFAVLASFVDSAELECAFVVLNSSQGLFLLAAFASNREVYRKCRSFASRLSSGSGTAMTVLSDNTTTATSAH